MVKFGKVVVTDEGLEVELGLAHLLLAANMWRGDGMHSAECCLV